MDNYRKIYNELVSGGIPRGYEVHHLDNCRKNNKIENLVAIPKEIHRAYHISHRALESLESHFFDTGDVSVLKTATAKAIIDTYQAMFTMVNDFKRNQISKNNHGR